MEILILADDFRKRFPTIIQRIDCESVPEGMNITFHGHDGCWCPFQINDMNMDLRTEFFVPAMRALENAQSNQQPIVTL